jgi:UDP-N-acetylmuramoyl-L-alanyl-D-glutamate--2,6-diaminopimelate ligase
VSVPNTAENFIAALTPDFFPDRILPQIKVESRKKEVTGISYDSRQVKAGNVFFCLPGEHRKGEEFVQQAVEQGAILIFSEDPLLESTVPVIVVLDVREAMAYAAHVFFGKPSESLRLIGVTGTNGKTTTTHLVKNIFARSGYASGLIGTLGASWISQEGEEKFQELAHTTPQAPEIQAILARMLADGVSHVAMEVSSHALALKRVQYCSFSTVCLTNVTQDHLDFHKTMEKYWRSKLLLFEKLNESVQKPKIGVVNLDDPLAHIFLEVLAKGTKSVTYSWEREADVRVEEAKFDFTGCHLKLHTSAGGCSLQLQLNGPFNVYNAMAALAIALAEGIDLETCKLALEDSRGVPGRFEIVSNATKEQAKAGSPSSEAPLCIVDYAHTPDGLKNILKAARALVPAKGKLVTVFGCGGDRDPKKRPQMGLIAQELSDLVFVTSDNPRSEDPDAIIAQIMTGMERRETIMVEPDRALAIEKAITLAANRDVVVVAGKGHETYQILADRTIPFDDRTQVRAALSCRQAGVSST